MSHVASVELEVKDLESLKKAVEALGLEFKEGQQTFHWFGSWQNDYNADNAAYRNGIPPQLYGKCLHAIAVPENSPHYKPKAGCGGTYELGVVQNPNGPGYMLVYDNFCGGYGLEQLIGKGAEKVKQMYAVKVAAKQARKQGYRVQEIPQDNGSIKVLATR